MKVLLLPTNIASDMSHKVKALRSLGVDARGITFSTAVTQDADGIEIIPSRRFGTLFATKRLYDAMRWADVLHWIWGFGSLQLQFRPTPIRISKIDKRLVQFLSKPGVIQWCGSDIRIPETDCVLNPYYARAWGEGYEYAHCEDSQRSAEIQHDFADVGFFPLEFIGMGHYINPDLFPRRFRIWQSIVLANHSPSFPSVLNKRPVVVHAPTAPVTKGTKYVLSAIDRLRAHFDFEFQLVQNVPRQQALNVMKSCDIYVDQLILGVHGSAAVEAMGFGKPVVCYINAEIGKDYPADLPIVNANPDNVHDVLATLIADATLRNEIGRKSRTYVEAYHSDIQVAKGLVNIYDEVIRLRNCK